MAGMRTGIWIVLAGLVGCSREVVDESFYAPDEVELVVELPGMDFGPWALPLDVGPIDDWNWSWQERFPRLVEARPTAPDGEATLPRPYYESAPLHPGLPRIVVSCGAVEHDGQGGWRALLRIGYRDPLRGVTWTQRVRLAADPDGAWVVDLGANPLTGRAQEARVRVRTAGPS